MSSQDSATQKGFQTLTPYLIVDQPHAFLQFLKEAFDAEQTLVTTGGAGGMHAEVRLGDSTVMLGGGAGISPIPTAIHLYVADGDSRYRQALEAGAVSLYQPIDQEYGDREAGIKDPSGNHWYIGTHRGAHFVPQGLHSVTAVLHPRDAAKAIEFIKTALDAQEFDCEKSPDGVILHAKLRLGNSVVELSEAHGQFQPMGGMFYLHVDNVDRTYRRALEAGAASLEEPTETSYGARRAGVRDSLGFQWYFAAPKHDG